MMNEASWKLNGNNFAKLILTGLQEVYRKMSISDKWPKDAKGLRLKGPQEILDMVSDESISNQDKTLMLLVHINFWLGLQWEHLQKTAQWQQENIIPFIKQSQKIDELMQEDENCDKWKQGN